LVEQKLGLLLAPLTTEHREHEIYTAILFSNITGIEKMELQVGITLSSNRLQQPDFMALVSQSSNVDADRGQDVVSLFMISTGDGGPAKKT
jgi:hypothetical protein